MSDNFKKSVSIILLFVFLYNISGYYFAFDLLKNRIKDVVHSWMEEKKSENLVLIAVSTEEKGRIEWEGNDEFRLNGKMYDLVSKKTEGNVLYLYCYSDSKEDRVFASLNKHIKNHIDNSTTPKNSKNKLKNPVPDFYAFPESGRTCYSITGKDKKTQNIFSAEDILIEFPSPPPRLS